MVGRKDIDLTDNNEKGQPLTARISHCWSEFA